MKTLVAALLLGTALCATPIAALAQDATTAATAPAAVTADSVVATVGGEPITEADIGFAAEDLQQQLQQVPQGEQKAFLVNVLIETKIIAEAAREQQMAEDTLFKQRLEYLEERELRRAYFAASTVAPEAIQAAYDEYLATLTDGEIHARHILVATEEEARAVKAALDAGKDFAELAKEKTIDPSGKDSGGDLGFFGRGMMVKPFEEAAFAMEAGAVSGPVKSDFGWHIIKVEEKRATTPPTLAEVTPQITQHLQFKTYEAGVTALRQGVVIEIPDPALAEMVNKQSPAQ